MNNLGKVIEIFVTSLQHLVLDATNCHLMVQAGMLAESSVYTAVWTSNLLYMHRTGRRGLRSLMHDEPGKR